MANIERKTDKRRDALDSDYIVELYQSGKSLASIAKEIKSSRSSVARRILWSGFPIRTVNESCSYFRNKSLPILSDDLLDIFNGLLLGDAWIESDGRSEGRLAITQCEKHLDWLIELKNIFDFYQIKNTLVKTKNRGWLLRTGKYTNFTKLKETWYINGIKTIPRELRITPLVLAHWYWGDGTLTNNGYQMCFCTDGFSKDNVLFLINLIKNDVGIHSTLFVKESKYPRIAIYRKQDRINIVNFVKEYCPKCFLYKLEIKK